MYYVYVRTQWEGGGVKSPIYFHCESNAKRWEGFRLHVKLPTYLMKGPLFKSKS